MNYTKLTVEDISTLVPIYIDYYNTYEDSEWTPETVSHRIHQVVTREDSYGLVLKDENVVIGFAMGYFEQYDDGKTYDLVEIVIAKEYQNKGIGTEFMKTLEQHVKEQGAFMVQLESVNDAMHRQFYGKLGYQDCNNLVLKSKML